MEQLICHLWGDYILQSHWMATNKTSKSLPSFVHVLFYGLPFLFLTFSPAALIVIITTHFLIDRFRLARFVIYAKNLITPESFVMLKNPVGATEWDKYVEQYSWSNCSKTGFNNNTPDWLAVWLLIIVDNTMHLTINYLSLRFL